MKDVEESFSQLLKKKTKTKTLKKRLDTLALTA